MTAETTTAGVTTAGDTTTPRPMRADARRNRERLVTAARLMLSERGVDASMDEIAKAADVGVGTLYRHFPRRIDLVEAVYRDDVDGLVNLAERVTAETEPWPALVAWLESFVAYARAKRNFLNELHEAFEKNPDLALTSREKVRSAVGQVLGQAQRAGVARPDIDGADLMQLVSGMCMAGSGTPDQAARLLQLVLDGVRAQPQPG